MHKGIIVGWVAVVVIGGGAIAGLAPRLGIGNDPSNAYSGAPQADWQVIGPAIISLVESAETSAKELASAELDAWRERVMAKVDREFLDDRTTYWNTTIGPLGSGITTYWRCIMSGFDCTEANRTASEEAQANFVAAFAAKVIGPTEAQRDLDAIRRKAEDRFIARVNDELGRMPPRWGLTPVAFNRELDRVVVITADVGGGRLEQVGLGTLAARAAASPDVLDAIGAAFRTGAQAIAGCKDTADACMMRAGMVVVGTLAGAAVKSGAPAAGAVAVAKSLGAGKAVSAGVGAVASVALAPIVLGAFEWWRHSSFVADEKPKLRAKIDASLRGFIDAALAGDGHIGATMRNIAGQAREKVDRRVRT